MIYALRTAKMFLVHLKHFYEIVACKLESLFPLMSFDFFFLGKGGGGSAVRCNILLPVFIILCILGRQET